ncbi:MAG TPA: HlyD family secretion protein [Rhizomicrobium sp.]|nr:HlyD family secretion protein [Rhizomicrobium sp.]
MPEREEKGRERAPDGPDRDGQQSPDRNGGPEKRRSFFANPLVRLAAVLIVVVIVIAGVLWWLNARQYESTDDAFIDTHIVQVAPQIAGQVSRVHVADNEFVKAGQPLVDLNSADEESRLAQILAQQAQAEMQIAQARATEAGATATERGAAATAQNAARDLARYRFLKRTAPAAVAQQQMDQAQATAKSAAAQREAAEAQIKGAAAQITGAEAQIRVLKAQEVQARINLGYTRIVAPLAGTIAQKTVALGNYVTPGTQMMAIVPLAIWVTANFKETQLAHMRVGQPVTVSVDACPDADIRGHVDSIQRGAGQAFGILPPENATGNYVKVVQRVPVKIVIDRVPRECLLGPGMSVEPQVKVR